MSQGLARPSFSSLQWVPPLGVCSTNLWGRRLHSWCWPPWCSWMEVSPCGYLGRDLCICGGRCSGPCLLFFSRSYSAHCAPAVPGAARGKQQGEDGAAVAMSTLLTRFLSTEPERDATHHPAEGSLHPHCRRWGSPRSSWFFSVQGCVVGGEDECSFCCWKHWVVEKHKRHKEVLCHKKCFVFRP